MPRQGDLPPEKESSFLLGWKIRKGARQMYLPLTLIFRWLNVVQLKPNGAEDSTGGVIMTSLAREAPGTRELLMGNEAIARGALEAGVQFATGYPGTPSSEIVESLARVANEAGIYVEWSTNEKVATEAAAAASFAGLRAFSAMKTAGINVALDFLAHQVWSQLSYPGQVTRFFAVDFQVTGQRCRLEGGLLDECFQKRVDFFNN